MILEILRFAQNDTLCHPERSEGSLVFPSRTHFRNRTLINWKWYERGIKPMENYPPSPESHHLRWWGFTRTLHTWDR